MTKAEYIQRLQDLADDNSQRARTIIVMSIDGAYKEIMQRIGRFLYDNEETAINSVVGQKYVELNASKVVRVWYDEQELIKTTESFPYAEDGIPTKFYVKGRRIYFDMKPLESKVVKVVYVPSTDVMTEADSPAFDDSYYHVLLSGATARFMQYEGDGAWEVYSMQFDKDLREMALEYGSKQPTNVL